MTYQSRDTSYQVISTILHGEVNDCYTARPEGSADGREYTLVVIKDHETVKTLMEVRSDIHLPHDGGEGRDSVIVDSFTNGGVYVIVFPYRQERPLDRFFVGEAYTLQRCEDICTNLMLTMNARELRHFFALRCCNRAQWEIRELADRMLKMCMEECPAIFQYAGPGCVAGQ
ncbi:MAG: FAD-dependent thymidylate synthase, partial [Lachnospiraceae bacterium]|nr:FAD-dependent thymidylate synthase [Lachnospiraceae bacterium]